MSGMEFALTNGMSKPPPKHHDPLPEVEVSGILRQFLLTPYGAVQGVILEDGTVGKVNKRTSIDPTKLARGEKLTLRGAGERYPLGMTLRLAEIERENGDLLRFPDKEKKHHGHKHDHTHLELRAS